MLTTQKRKFALALMSGKNKTASALAAGYSAKTARVKGSQLAKDPEVLAFIARKQCETVEVDEVPVYRQKKSEPEDKPRRREAAAIPQPDETNPEMPPPVVISHSRRASTLLPLALPTAWRNANQSFSLRMI